MQQAEPEAPARGPAARGDRRAVGPQSVTPGGAAPPARPPLGRAALPVDATLAGCLQRAVENRAAARDVQRLREGAADGGLLQRRVTVGTKQYNVRERLPAFPPTMAARYQDRVVTAVTNVVEGWRDDAVTAGRTWTDASKLYQAAIDQVIEQGGAAAASTTAPWARLAFAVAREDANGMVEMPWASFGAGGAALEDELKKCNVQISSNPDTTACHGNSHNRLPKKVITPTGVPLDDVEKEKQPLYTPYYEFLIPGHKSENEIERGVLDRNSRQIYITAHYESGSFVWLSGAPKALLDNWVMKASKYRQHLMK
jgi:hypothetical protein